MKYDFEQPFQVDTSKFVKFNPGYLTGQFGTVDVTSFWVAEMDFKVMPKLIDRLKERADEGIFCYEYKTADLKQALSGWFERRHGLPIDTSNLMFTPSVLNSLAALIDEFTEPGEGVIIQPPVYQAFASIIKGLDREVVNNPLLLEDGVYTMDFTNLEEMAASPVNTLMVLCSPHNPVGRVWKTGELEQLADICLRHNVLLITDEIHCDVVYPGHQFTGMTSIYEEHSENVIMVGSAGKSFGIPGLVDSFIYTPGPELKETIMARIMKYHLGKSNAFANTTLETVYTEGDNWLDAFTSYMQGNIELVRSFCSENTNKVKLIEPEGTYQVWLDFRAYPQSEEALLKLLCTKAGLGLTKGSSYGEEGDKFFRMNIACPRAEIAQALEGIKKALSGL